MLEIFSCKRRSGFVTQLDTTTDIIIEITGANPSLVNFKDSEILTTTKKIVDISKSIEDLNHKNTVSLYDGLKITADWMKSIYNL